MKRKDLIFQDMDLEDEIEALGYVAIECADNLSILAENARKCDDDEAMYNSLEAIVRLLQMTHDRIFSTVLPMARKAKNNGKD